MPRIERFAVGPIDCQIVPDGVAMYDPADFAAGVPADQIIAALTVGVDEKGEVAVPYNGLLIRVGGRVALVDAGLGAEGARQFGEPAGRLMDSLTASGITADQIDLVIISHAHLDHIGGLTVPADGGRSRSSPGRGITSGRPSGTSGPPGKGSPKSLRSSPRQPEPTCRHCTRPGWWSWSARKPRCCRGCGCCPPPGTLLATWWWPSPPAPTAPCTWVMPSSTRRTSPIPAGCRYTSGTPAWPWPPARP